LSGTSVGVPDPRDRAALAGSLIIDPSIQTGGRQFRRPPVLFFIPLVGNGRIPVRTPTAFADALPLSEHRAPPSAALTRRQKGIVTPIHSMSPNRASALAVGRLTWPARRKKHGGMER